MVDRLKQEREDVVVLLLHATILHAISRVFALLICPISALHAVADLHECLHERAVEEAATGPQLHRYQIWLLLNAGVDRRVAVPLVQRGSQRQERIEVCGLLRICGERVIMAGWDHAASLPLSFLGQVYQLLHECLIRQIVLDDGLQLVPEE